MMLNAVIVLTILGTLCTGNVNCFSASESKKPKTYNYFAFGSNMASATMTKLRQLNPIASTAAVLPGHRLAFNVPGTPFVEPSWASVEPVVDDNQTLNSTALVHGVLYKLSAKDFEAVCRTEGVPLGYNLHRCRVVPYCGDGMEIGKSTLASEIDRKGSLDEIGVRCFTLRAGKKEWRESSQDIAPSRSYLNVLIRGAKEFDLDKDYVEILEALPVGRTLIGNGIAEGMLSFAENS